MSEEEFESPYCEVCGHCGEIGCCGIRNFIEEHIEGKTNCKNEAYIIQELIDLCDYKDKVFEKNKKLEFQLQEKENIIKEVEKYLDEYIKPSVRENKTYDFVGDLFEIYNILDKVGEDNE